MTLALGARKCMPVLCRHGFWIKLWFFFSIKLNDRNVGLFPIPGLVTVSLVDTPPVFQTREGTGYISVFDTFFHIFNIMCVLLLNPYTLSTMSCMWISVTSVLYYLWKICLNYLALERICCRNNKKVYCPNTVCTVYLDIESLMEMDFIDFNKKGAFLKVSVNI